MPRTNILVISFAAVVVASICLIAKLWLGRESSEIERNKRALLNLRFPCGPKHLRGYVQWNLQGRHTFNQVSARQQLLVKRLLELGYLEQRDFPLGHQAGRYFEQRLDRLVRHDGRLNEPLASWGIGFRPAPKSEPTSWMQEGPDVPTISVTTRPDQMKIWERLLVEFDLTNHPPNHHLQPTPR